MRIYTIGVAKIREMSRLPHKKPRHGPTKNLPHNMTYCKDDIYTTQPVPVRFITRIDPSKGVECSERCAVTVFFKTSYETGLRGHGAKNRLDDEGEGCPSAMDSFCTHQSLFLRRSPILKGTGTVDR